MQIHPYKEVHKICRKLPPNYDGIYRLTTVKPQHVAARLKFDKYTYSCNCYVRNLWAKAQINSVSPSNIPQFSDFDNETQRLTKALDIMWKSPSKFLSVLEKEESNEWQDLGYVALLANNQYPYQKYKLLDMVSDDIAEELGQSPDIAVKIIDSGYGLLQPNDEVVIYGSYSLEFSIFDYTNMPIYQPPSTTTISLPKSSSSTNSTVAVSDSGSLEILPANQNRLGYHVKNNTNGNIYLDFDIAATANSTLVLVPGATYYNDPFVETRQLQALAAVGISGNLETRSYF